LAVETAASTHPRSLAVRFVESVTDTERAAIHAHIDTLISRAEFTVKRKKLTRTIYVPVGGVSYYLELDTQKNGEEK
jgi:hypothetical protein